MAWYIDPNINDGYPTNTGFPESYPTGWQEPYPHSAWRIKSGVNEGYPYIWYWYPDEGGGGGGGLMQIGGRQTNFPGGLHNLAASQIPFDTTGTVFNDNPSIGVFLASTLRAYAAAPSTIISIRNDIIDFCQNITNSIHNQIIAITGTGLTDVVIQCKIYPFDLPNDNVEPTEIELIRFSANDAFTIRPNIGSTLAMARLSNTIKLLDFGNLNLSITQGWELDGISWSIYLPYAGTYSIQIKGTEQLNLKCVVDILSGQCEYYLLAGGEIILNASGKMGVDVPFNTAQAAQMQNLNGWRTNQIVKGMSLAADLVEVYDTMQLLKTNPGDVDPNGGGGSSSLSSIGGNVAVNAPSIGGGVGFATPQVARLIASVPEMQANGYGYAEILGTRKEYAKAQLSSVSGYVRCKNYKCEVIIATTAEKQEIERLLNEGVFL